MSRCCALLQIDDKIVDSRVVTEFFSCDLSVCHGACCVEGSSGAPLEAWEIEGLDVELPELLEMLPARNVQALRTGVAYRDGDGEWVTRMGANAHFRAMREGSLYAVLRRHGEKG